MGPIFEESVETELVFAMCTVFLSSIDIDISSSVGEMNLKD